MRRSRDAKIAALSACAVLPALGPGRVNSLARVAEVIDAPAGAVLQEVGEPFASWWVVLEGVVVIDHDGVSALVAAGGGWGADTALRREPTDGRAVAVSPVRCLVVARHHVENLLNDIPELAVGLLRDPRLGALA